MADSLHIDPDSRLGKAISKSRYEAKYLVSNATAEAIRRYIQPWAVPDPYAARDPEHSYRISSLYLDNPGVQLFRETREGRENRIKLRIRSYSQDEEAPVFLEIKRRLNRVVHKSRVPVARDLARDLLDRRFHELDLEGAILEDGLEFLRLSERLNARPVVHIGYRRQAYIGRYHPGTRVTFDRELSWGAPGRHDVLVPDTDTWPIEDVRVVLELKFNRMLPGWMQQVIRRFNLNRISFSKYGTAVRMSGTRRWGYSSYLSRNRVDAP